MYSLVAGSAANLTQWLVGTERYDLEPLHRHLCIIEDTGRLGWARVGKTRITYFETSFRPVSLRITIDGMNHGLSYTALSPTPERRVNLSISVRLHGEWEVARVTAWYTPASLRILEISEVGSATPSKNRSPAARWLHENAEKFSRTVRESIATPFKYTNNLTGVEADKFFGTGRPLTLRLVLDGPFPIVVAHSF
ncbi:hypothetical protein [Paraburkholderia sediminicola]|uniref:hypothetical protein n=1 Tax=Paraburkholderia sediminicola TaxID=458836 RepID=UPI0038B91649